jgi:peroxiredoxin
MTKKLLFVFTILTSTFIANAQSQIPEKAEDISPLLIGEQIPEAQLLDANGKDVKLQTILKEKPTVLVFYRGGWCPYCNTQLSGLAEIETDIEALGYQIIAISPDNYKNLKPTIDADEVAYQLYADPGAKFIQEVGIGFETPEKAKPFIVERTSFEASNVLPVPTVMIVDSSGTILFEYINPNYKVRLSSELLLASLKALKTDL